MRVTDNWRTEVGSICEVFSLASCESSRVSTWWHAGCFTGYHSTVVAEFKTVVGEFQIPSMPKIVTTEATALILAA